MKGTQHKEQAGPQRDWKSLVEQVSYRGIVRNIPYMAFVVLLCIMYITNNHRAIDVQRELNKQTRVLKELRWKYMDIKSKVLYAGMESEVIRRASAMGLRPLTLPAYSMEPDTATKAKQ